MIYDPDRGPDQVEWLALDETERLRVVIDYHRHASIELPSSQAHAAAHVAIESQLALGDPPAVRAALTRLTEVDGLGRHEAVHAIAGVLVVLLSDLLAKRVAPAAFGRLYAAELGALGTSGDRPRTGR